MNVCARRRREDALGMNTPEGSGGEAGSREGERSALKLRMSPRDVGCRSWATEAKRSEAKGKETGSKPKFSRLIFIAHCTKPRRPTLARGGRALSRPRVDIENYDFCLQSRPKQ